MSQKTILYVDDEEDLRLLVAAALQAEGYRVLSAANVPEALRMAFAEFPDLVITDVIMPGESGYSLCTKLRSDPSTKDLPIVVLTILDDERPALKAGATAFLSKPFDVAALRKVVSEVLRPTDSKSVLNAALEQLRANQVPRAKQGFLEVLETDPKSPMAKWARYYVGQIEQHEGNHARAVDHFRALLDEDASFWRAHNRLGMIFEARGEGTTAVKHYQRSLALNPQQPDVKEKLERLLKAPG